jgi:mRNA (guanine-N7-)-methyltransferase
MICICRYKQNNTRCQNCASHPSQNPKVCDQKSHIQKYIQKAGGSKEVYYTKEAKKKKRSVMRDFHNYVKKTIFNQVAPSKSTVKEGKILEVGSGKGGDLFKWKGSLYKEVVGIEHSLPNIEEGYSRLRKLHRLDLPKVTYIWGDFRLPLYPDYKLAGSDKDRETLKRLIPSKNMFDVVSCQFALHYFFKDEETVRQVLLNISDSLKKGGYFIGTTFDGERVYNSLKGKKSIQRPDSGVVEWRIKKLYKTEKWNRKKSNVGMKISIYIDSIGTEQEEYLVNFTFLKKVMKEYGLKTVAIKRFSQIYNEYNKTMLKHQKEYSFHFNSFVFQKI